MSSWNERANQVFLELANCGDSDERESLLTAACGDDQSLRDCVSQLLEAHDSAGAFLDCRAEDTDSEGFPIGMVPPFFASGSMFAGKFRIQRFLGCGGMGLVALAEQQEPLQRLVAIKVIRPDANSPGVLRRFERERSLLASMHHPGIASVWEAGYVDSITGRVPRNECSDDDAECQGAQANPKSAETLVPFLAMEFIDGIAIDQFCIEHQLTRDEILELVVSICSAIEHAHQKGVIHRDIKPSNLLVSRNEEGPSCKIIDFGVVKPFAQALLNRSQFTATGNLLGTIDFMSPEQLSGEEIDTRSDVYSMGVVLYQLLTGVLPHSSLDDTKIDLWAAVDRIRHHDPIRPGLRPRQSGVEHEQFPAELDWILLKALSTSRHDRYPTITALAEDLRRHIEQQPVTAHPPDWRYLLGKSYRRHRSLVRAAVVAMLLMVLGIAGTGWGLVQAQREADRARHGENEIHQQWINSLYQSAVSAVRRGQWDDALSLSQTALEAQDADEVSSLPDRSVEFYLLRLDAMNGIRDFDGIREVVKALDSMSLLPPQLAQFRLWQAELALVDGDEPLHRRRIDEALALGLRPADEHYARALLANATPDSIDLLLLALELDPFHYRATRLLPVLLATLGRFDEAQGHVTIGLRLYPRDPVFVTVAGCQFALEGERQKIDDLLAKYASQLTEQQFEDVHHLFETLETLGRSMNAAVRSPGTALLTTDTSFYESQLSLDRVLQSQNLSLPFACRNNIEQCVAAVGATFATGDLQSAISSLESASSLHPEGLLLYLKGSLQSIEKQWELAESSFEQATELPSCFASVRGAALFALIMSRVAMQSAEEADATAKDAIARLIEYRLTLDELNPQQLGQLAKAAKYADDLRLAHRLIQMARYRDPDSQQILVFEAQIELAMGRLEQARQAAESALISLQNTKSLPLPQRNRLINLAKSVLAATGDSETAEIEKK